MKKIETNESGDQLLNKPPELNDSGLFLEGDEESFSVRNDRIMIKNFSCIQVPWNV